MSTDPCSYMNANATSAACIASGGKPSADPCNILNPLANKSSCTTNQAAQQIAKSGMPDWAKALIAIGMLLVIVIGTYIAIKFNSILYGTAGGKRGGTRGGSRR